MFPELTFEEPPAPSRRVAMPQGLGAWVSRIRQQDMPAFGATVAAVHHVAEDDSASASLLAQAILQDPAMTTRVLRLANSAYYNPGRQAVSTISRAIVVLGFDVVAGIAVTVSLVDALLQGGVRQRIHAEMAQSLQAAVLARRLAELRHDSAAEEAFIAALLARVGALAFWCFGGAAAESLNQALNAGTQKAEDVQLAQLGFKLSHLSLGLAREWKLGALLVGALELNANPGASERVVRLGCQLASAAAMGGWEHPATRQCLTDISEFCQIDLAEVRELALQCALDAARVATSYGAAEAAALIPRPSGEILEVPVESEGREAPTDPLLQLRILRELTAMIQTGGGSINDVVSLALEGLYRAVGFSRVLLALVNPARTQLVAKAALGRGADHLRAAFVLGLGEVRDVVDDVVSGGKPQKLPNLQRGPAYAQRLRALGGAEQAVIAPVLAQGRIVAVIYADLQDGAGMIDNERYQSFMHFVQHVCFAFANIGALRR